MNPTTLHAPTIFWRSATSRYDLQLDLCLSCSAADRKGTTTRSIIQDPRDRLAPAGRGIPRMIVPLLHSPARATISHFHRFPPRQFCGVTPSPSSCRRCRPIQPHVVCLDLHAPLAPISRVSRSRQPPYVHSRRPSRCCLICRFPDRLVGGVGALCQLSQRPPVPSRLAAGLLD